MSLSSIPSLCLLTILDRIPLHDLLSTVNLVCHRWAQLRPVACQRRHSLFLYDNQNYLNHIKQHKFAHDHDVKSAVIKDDGTPFDEWIYVKYQLEQNGLRLTLQVSTQNQSLAQLLSLLPNISHLQLGQSVTCWPTVIPPVNRLLEKWSTKLVQLNLWLHNQQQAYVISPDNDYHPGLIDQLFDRLNQLTSLRRLTIQQLDLPQKDPNSVIEYSLTSKLSTVLSRVDHFEYGGNFQDKVFEGHILKDIETVLKAQSCQLKSITLKPGTISLASAIGRLSRCFMSKLTTFSLGVGIEDQLSDMYLVMSRLSAIESLYFAGDISRAALSFPDFIGRLSHLSRLTFMAFEHIPECFFMSITESPQPPPTQPLPQIRSLKAMRIRIELSLSHQHLDQLAIPVLFPNVQVFKLHQSIFIPSGLGCTDCNYMLESCIPSVNESQPVDGPTEAMLEQCARLTLRSLNNFSNNINQKRVIRFIRSAFPPGDIVPAHMSSVFSATYTPGQI